MHYVKLGGFDVHLENQIYIKYRSDFNMIVISDTLLRFARLFDLFLILNGAADK